MDALELTAVVLWCFLVALAGGLVGLVLGNIRLPVLLLVASSPAAGAGANIGVSGVAATAASAVHIRAGRVNWRLFWVLLPPSIVGAVAGGLLSGELPGDVLLGVIALSLLWFGIDLLRPKEAVVPKDPGAGLNVRAAVIAGVLIGFLGGLVGLILGSLRVPALIRHVGEAPTVAVGTSLAVGIFVGIAGVFGHAPAGVDWDLLAIGAAASIPGALIGARLTGRLSEAQLMRAIGVVLLVAAGVTGAQAIF